MILEIDEKILENFKENDLKIYFYNSGCEWTKINLTWEFEKKWLESFSCKWKNIFYEKNDETNLNWWKILLKPNDNKWHQTSDKYIFISPKIQSRCWCATSFSFEKKLISKDKLKKLKIVFKKS